MISDVRGKSGRAMIKALIAGERDPAKLARLADPRLKASPAQLSEALRGRVTKNHRFLLRLHLRQIDALDAAIAAIDRQVEADIAPFRTAVKACMCPRNDESAGKRRSNRLRKGAPWLKTTLVQSARAAVNKKGS